MTWRRGEHGLTPLHEAAQRNIVNLARVILKFKPDLSIEDSTFGGTPLDWAQQCRNEEIVKIILKHQESQETSQKKKKVANKNKKKGGKKKR